MQNPNPEMIDDEIPELDDEWFARARPAREVLPLSLQKKLGMLDAQDDEPVQLSHAVIERFRATGAGWQARIDVALQDWLKTHSPG